MKTNVTKKWINENFENVIQMRYEPRFEKLSPSWYTCGVYGWNADIYMLDFDTVIVIGYRPFGTKFEKLPESCQKHIQRLIDDKMED